MIPTYFKECKADVERRKELKKRLDSIVNLSSDNVQKPMENLNVALNSKEKIRLLNEGAIFDGYDELRMYIKKGAIPAFVESLSDDFVGYITLGHLQLDQVPLLMGTWTKSDLEVVDVGEGRYALDCTPHFNDSGFVQDILSQEIPLSVSVEIDGAIDWDSTELLEAPVWQKLRVNGFSVVGLPANVDSWDIGEDMKLDELMEMLEKLTAAKEEKPETQEAETQEETEKPAEPKVPENEEPGNPEEPKNEDSAKEPKNEEPQDEAEKKLAEILTRFEEIAKENKDLRAKLEEKEAEEEKLNYQAKKVLDMFESKLNSSVPKEKKGKDPIWGC